MHRRIDVTEGELVGRHLPIRVRIPLAQQKHELVHGKLGVDLSQRDHVKGKVPGGEPGILPLVRHREDVARVEVLPIAVSSERPARWRGRLGRVALDPVLHHVIEELLAPEEARVSLPEHTLRLDRKLLLHHARVELIGFADALGENALELVERIGPPLLIGREAQPHRALPLRRHDQDVVKGGLRSHVVRVDRVGLAVDHMTVEGVLHVRQIALHAEDARVVRLVLGEEDQRHRSRGRSAKRRERRIDEPGGFRHRQGRRGDGARGRRRRLGIQAKAPEAGMSGENRQRPGALELRPRPVVLSRSAPRPGVSEPERRQKMQRRRLGPSVVDGQANEDIVGRGLGVLDLHIEVAVLVEQAGVDQLVLRRVHPPLAVLLHQRGVGEFALRVLVQRLHVGVGRGRVEVEVELLHILAVISLRTGQAEEALLQDRVLAVPEGEGEAEAPLAIGDAQEPVFAPAVGARARVVVREVAPAVAVLGVVLADRAPLPLGEVRPPPLPVLVAAGVLGQTGTLGIELTARTARGFPRGGSAGRRRLLGLGASRRVGFFRGSGLLHSPGARGPQDALSLVARPRARSS